MPVANHGWSGVQGMIVQSKSRSVCYVSVMQYLPCLCRCAVACLTILVEMRELGMRSVASCSSSESSVHIRSRISIAWQGAAWRSIAWHSTAWHNTGIAWYSVAWYSIAWCSIAWYSIAQQSTAQHGMARHSRTAQSSTAHCIAHMDTDTAIQYQKKSPHPECSLPRHHSCLYQFWRQNLAPTWPQDGAQLHIPPET